jgi:hypothetical protein
MPADHPDLHAVAREILDSSFYMTLGTPTPTAAPGCRRCSTPPTATGPS